MFKKIILSSTLLGLLIFSAIPAQAQQSILPKIDDESRGCTINGVYERSAEKCGNYNLDDFVKLLVNATTLVLSLVGSIALIMFIFGGITMMVSGGNKEQIDKGRKAIVAAAIGLIIVFSSYMIMQFTLKSLGIEWTGGGIIKVTQHIDTLNT